MNKFVPHTHTARQQHRRVFWLIFELFTPLMTSSSHSNTTCVLTKSDQRMSKKEIIILLYNKKRRAAQKWQLQVSTQRQSGPFKPTLESLFSRLLIFCSWLKRFTQIFTFTVTLQKIRWCQGQNWILHGRDHPHHTYNVQSPSLA